MTRWLPFSLVLLGFVLIGCKGGNTPKGDGATTEGNVAQDGKVGKDQKAKDAKPDFTLTADEFGKEFVADKGAAEKKYAGKTVEVTGAVWMVLSNDGVVLSGLKAKDDDDLKGASTAARIRKAHWYAAGRLSKGQKVKVVGKSATSLIGGGALVDCTLVELEASKLLSVTAENLAKEFETDSAAAAKKYEKMELVVSGKMEEAVAPKEGGYFARLTGTGKTRVKIIVGFREFEDIKDLKKDTPVDIRASFSTAPSLKHNEITLQSGHKLVAK